MRPVWYFTRHVQYISPVMQVKLGNYGAGFFTADWSITSIEKWLPIIMRELEEANAR